MLLAISAISLITLLIAKEIMAVSISGKQQRLVNFMYIPIVPLLILFAVEAAIRISQLPAIR